MNKGEILNKYIDLIDKGYCSDCNELNCIDNFPHAKITHGIRELQQENQKYKEVIDKVNNKLSQYKNDLKEYQEQDRINHQNISIGLVGVKIRAFEDILKEVE